MALDLTTGKDYDQSTDWLGQLPHAKLVNMRDAAGNGKDIQNLLGPYEHQAFAREVVKDNPLMSAPALAGALLYDPAKLTPWANGRSDPSMQSMAQSLLGWRQGYAATNPRVQAPGLLDGPLPGDP